MGAVAFRLYFWNRSIGLLRTVFITVSGAFLASLVLSYISLVCGFEGLLGGGIGGDAGYAVVSAATNLIGHFATALLLIVLVVALLLVSNKKFAYWFAVDKVKEVADGSQEEAAEEDDSERIDPYEPISIVDEPVSEVETPEHVVEPVVAEAAEVEPEKIESVAAAPVAETQAGETPQENTGVEVVQGNEIIKYLHSRLCLSCRRQRRRGQDYTAKQKCRQQYRQILFHTQSFPNGKNDVFKTLCFYCIKKTVITQEKKRKEKEKTRHITKTLSKRKLALAKKRFLFYNDFNDDFTDLGGFL